VTEKVAHNNPSPFSSAKAGYCSGLAALLFFIGGAASERARAEGDTRTISLHHIHTGEDLTITYKVNGRYDDNALAKIDSLLRDWREDKPTRMDPHVIDLLWEVHREVGAKEPIWIVCGYRSPSTNATLRKRSSGVAKFSQHMLGKAVDFYIPGVPLDQLRAAGLRAQQGGVGFYPTSGSPFVHLDTGSVRHWPRLPEAQLASVLAKGPLTSRSASDPRGTALARGEIVRPDRKPTQLAKLPERGKEVDEEDDAPARAQAAETKPAKEAPAIVARAQAAIVPLPRASPRKPEFREIVAESPPEAAPNPGNEIPRPAAAPVGFEIASARAKPIRLAQVQTPDRVNSTANDVINGRGYWQGMPNAEPIEVAPAANSRVPQTVTPAARRPATAAAGPAATGSAPTTSAGVAHWPLADGTEREPLPNALSYASQPTPIAISRAVPLGRPIPPAEPTSVVKRNDDRVPSAGLQPDEPGAMPARKVNGGLVRVGDRFNDPWMRAMIVSPSAQSFMKTTLFGLPDFRNLGAYFEKPAASVAMTFSEDPTSGMPTEQFAGTAVTFVGSVKFAAPSAAAR
jgi:uncharacterized protein YcbK (DUF882 family)